MMELLRLPLDFEPLTFSHQDRRVRLVPGLRVWLGDRPPVDGDLAVLLEELDDPTGPVVLLGVIEERPTGCWLRHPLDGSLDLRLQADDEPRRVEVDALPDDDVTLIRWGGLPLTVPDRTGRPTAINRGSLLYLRERWPEPGRLGLMMALVDDELDMALGRLDAAGRFCRCRADGSLEAGEALPAGADVRLVEAVSLPVRRLEEAA